MSRSRPAFRSVRQFKRDREIGIRENAERVEARRVQAQVERQALSDCRMVPTQSISLRLAYREPFAAGTLFDFLGARAIPGVEIADGGYVQAEPQPAERIGIGKLFHPTTVL